MKIIFPLIACVLLSCNQKTGVDSKKIDKSEKNSLRKISQEKQEKNPIITFLDGSESAVTPNIRKGYNADSVIVKKKSFLGTYIYCGKGSLNLLDLEILKSKNLKEFKKLSTINTAHQIFTKNHDTLYISGVNELKCLDQNDSVELQVSLYKFFFKKNEENLIVIDSFKKLK